MLEILKHLTEHRAPWLEKALRRAENSRNDIRRDSSLLKFLKIVSPEFIFHKYSHPGSGRIKKSIDISGYVERQIYHRDPRIVIAAHFIARRREKTQKYTFCRIMSQK